MAPSKFQIYVDQSIKVPSGQMPPQQMPAQQMQPQQMQQMQVDQPVNGYPTPGIELSSEELRLLVWYRRRYEMLEKENENLKQQLVSKPQPPPSRLSIVPQSLQPAQGGDTSCYGGLNEAPSVVQDWWKHTIQMDKFTVPIDQSEFIRENCATSTPSNKRTTNRRQSRPSVGGGSPTMKLSPITETSRDCNSKSSSSTSTPGPLSNRPVAVLDKPLDPNDPLTYFKLLKTIEEPLERRSSYMRLEEDMPDIKNGVCFGTCSDSYLVDKQLATGTYTAQLLDDSDDSDSNLPTKTVILYVALHPNDWLFYVCDELHKRLVKQKTKPDIELSIMNADPAIIYTNGSIIVDEYFKFVPLKDYLVACTNAKRLFPRSVAAYLTLELLQLVRGIHSCDIIHMNINPETLIVTGCPTREDVASVNERTSILKLIGFDRALDARLVPKNFRFDINCANTFGVLDSYCHELDWVGVLNCISRMFFGEDLSPVKEGDRWKVNQEFKGFPTNIWSTLFDGLLNIQDIQKANELVDGATAELSTWTKANINFVLREATNLDSLLEKR